MIIFPSLKHLVLKNVSLRSFGMNNRDPFSGNPFVRRRNIRRRSSEPVRAVRGNRFSRLHIDRN